MAMVVAAFCVWAALVVGAEGKRMKVNREKGAEGGQCEDFEKEYCTVMGTLSKCLAKLEEGRIHTASGQNNIETCFSSTYHIKTEYARTNCEADLNCEWKNNSPEGIGGGCPARGRMVGHNRKKCWPVSPWQCEVAPAVDCLDQSHAAIRGLQEEHQDCDLPETCATTLADFVGIVQHPKAAVETAKHAAKEAVGTVKDATFGAAGKAKKLTGAAVGMTKEAALGAAGKAFGAVGGTLSILKEMVKRDDEDKADDTSAGLAAGKCCTDTESDPDEQLDCANCPAEFPAVDASKYWAGYRCRFNWGDKKVLAGKMCTPAGSED